MITLLFLELSQKISAAGKNDPLNRVKGERLVTAIVALVIIK